MRWIGGRQSANIEDRRGMRIGPGLAGGGIGGVVLVLIALFLGVDPSILLDEGGPVPQTSTERPASPEEERLREFVATVLADTEDTWHAIFNRMGGRYEEPTLVLFSGAVQSACGFAQSAVGPFYCGADRKLYLDFSFFDDMARKLQAPGDAAQAYVIAHEVGHHVQNLLGITDEVASARQRLDAERGNALSVRLELQADCFAGLWAHHAQRTRNILEPGDIDEALGAASAVGDDRLQMRQRGYVVPESFTHGTSEQRKGWFRRGFDTGELRQCDTFRAERS